MYTGLKTGIKVNNVEHLTDARYFAAAGVNYIGFDMSKLSDEMFDLELTKVVNIKEWVSGPRIFVSLTTVTEDILEKLFKNGIDAIEVENSNELVGLEGFHWFLPMDAFQKDTELATFDNVERVTTLYDWESSHHKKAWIKDFDMNSMDHFFDNNALGIQIEGSPQEKIGFKSYDDYDKLFELLEN